MADKPPDSCPVDHTARQAWIDQARASTPATPPSSCPVDHAQRPRTWTETLTSYLPFTSSPAAPPSTSETKTLPTDRVISSIPRTTTTTNSPCPVPHGASANAETAAATHDSGNWVYPSEKMFFDAMQRKGYSAREADMKTVVPIHNAVNEKAWEHIRKWEAPYLSTCGGPKLESFGNKADRMTPTARMNTLLGYAAPFDRHDWVIDRCGTRVEYVIDFYAGRADGKPGPSFYLDVRPKLNTWEGVKMRAAKWAMLT